MTRDEIFDRMPNEVAEKVYDNMIAQDEWEAVDDNDYFDDLEFLVSAFSWDCSYEGVEYWIDYVDSLEAVDNLLSDCLSDE